MSFQFLSRFVRLRSCVLASASNVKQEAQIQMVVYTPGVLSQCVSTTCTARVLVWLCSRLLEGSPWVLCIVLPSFLAEILEGSCIHFHLHFVFKYIKKTDTHNSKMHANITKKPWPDVDRLSYGTLQALSKI